MARIRLLGLAVLALSTLGLLAAPAGAHVAAATGPSAKFCSAAAKIGTGEKGGSPTPATAAKTFKQFKAAAKYAPAKVKAAGNRIASVLTKIAEIKPTNASDLAKFYTSGDFKSYESAVVTFFQYTEQCTSG